MKQYILPDYDKSIVNLVSSLLNHYSVCSEYKSIRVLDKVLEKKHRNVVVMVFDGLGQTIVRKTLPADSFILANNAMSLTSVFPSTTTAAMTSYYSGVSPNEHGWIGWSLFFKEYSRMIDIFLDKDSFSGQDIGNGSIAKKLMPYESIFSKIKKRNPDIQVHTLQPSHIDFPSNGNVNIPIDTLQDLFENVSSICGNGKQNFIFSYWDNPDSVMHTTGCFSKDVVEYVSAIDHELLKMTSSLKDTLVIVTADHGQTPIAKEYHLNDYPELMECMFLPPFMEARAVSIVIKPGKIGVFKKLFRQYFKDEFILMTRKEIYRKKLFGRGKSHGKISDFIGDYVAIGIKDSIIRYKSPNNKAMKHFLGHHAGLSDSEMLIPLIIKET